MNNLIKLKEWYYDTHAHGDLTKPLLINVNEISSITETTNNRDFEGTTIIMNNGVQHLVKEIFDEVCKMIDNN